jgi:hypothetical protein
MGLQTGFYEEIQAAFNLYNDSLLKLEVFRQQRII